MSRICPVVSPSFECADDQPLPRHRHRVYFGDHPPPHIHVEYSGHQARIDFRTGDVLTGDLPRRVERMVVEWCELRCPELERNWKRAQAKLPLDEVDPLP